MCLGVPARVISLEGNMAEVAIGAVTYKANIGLLDAVSPGDYIILHAGFAIEKVDPTEAEETIRLVREIQQDPDEEADGRDQ
jgi:hydrogenase expression/formation protein HypC